MSRAYLCGNLGCYSFQTVTVLQFAEMVLDRFGVVTRSAMLSPDLQKPPASPESAQP